MSQPRRVLDEGKRREIIAILGVGCSQTLAAEYVGCSRSTIRREAERDAEFAKQMRQAIGNAELGLVKSIRKAAMKEQYWRAAAWALERLFPEKYARRGPDVITAEQLAEILARLGTMIITEAPSAKYRQKVVKGLEKIARSFGHTVKREVEEQDDAPAETSSETKAAGGTTQQRRVLTSNSKLTTQNGKKCQPKIRPR
jgi:hypothetical protein